MAKGKDIYDQRKRVVKRKKMRQHSWWGKETKINSSPVTIIKYDANGIPIEEKTNDDHIPLESEDLGRHRLKEWKDNQEKDGL
jgi:hypothetical protein